MDAKPGSMRKPLNFYPSSRQMIIGFVAGILFCCFAVIEIGYAIGKWVIPWLHSR